jgi:hypothetical protein
VIVDVSFLVVVALLILPAVIMTVGDFGVVVLVGVPEHPVLDFARIIHVVGNMPVIMFMGDGRMSVFRLPTLALGVLMLGHG